MTEQSIMTAMFLLVTARKDNKSIYEYLCE